MTTTTVPAMRGCGDRAPGGLYLSLGIGDEGLPWWKFLYDPPVPFMYGKFQGVHIAPPELTRNMGEDDVLLLDMVSARDYTVATFVEEVRRYGLSRRIASTFNFSQLQEKRVWLGLIHWNAIIRYERASFPGMTFRYCENGGRVGVSNSHFLDCIFHQWLRVVPMLAHRRLRKGEKAVYTDDVGNIRIRMPSFSFDPLNVLGDGRCESFVARVAGYDPGIFAAFPITHVEVVGGVLPGSNVDESGLKVVVMEE